MPHLDIRVSRRLDAAAKDALQREIGGAMELLPGKTISNTMMEITDGCSIYKGGAALEGAFVDVRLLKESPGESKKAFSEKLFEIFTRLIDMPPDNVQINFIELPNWASGGVYR